MFAAVPASPLPGHGLPDDSLALVDEDGERVELDEFEATLLLDMTRGLEPATVSACPGCRSRVVAVVAFLDVLEGALAHERVYELTELGEDAPTLHLYVADLASTSGPTPLPSSRPSAGFRRSAQAANSDANDSSRHSSSASGSVTEAGSRLRPRSSEPL